LNITRRADGEWRAIDARGIFRAQRLGNEIYQAELRKELLGLGYEVQSPSSTTRPSATTRWATG
jgi:hypothetical protein